jgi:CheY-like chemotaxis protein
MNRTDENSPKILVIDDDEGIRDMLAAVLACSGFRTLVAEGGEEGLRIAACDGPALILCDGCMPGMNGFEVAARLRADPGTASIPLVIMSGRPVGDDETVSAGLYNCFLQKPFSPPELVRVVRGAIAQAEQLAVLAA